MLPEGPPTFVFLYRKLNQLSIAHNLFHALLIGVLLKMLPTGPLNIMPKHRPASLTELIVGSCFPDYGTPWGELGFLLESFLGLLAKIEYCALQLSLLWRISSVSKSQMR